MNWLKNASYLILALSISGCSFFKRIDALEMQYDLQKQDRAKVTAPAFNCPDPDPMGVRDVYPHREDGDKGIVRFTSDDYDLIADNLQGDHKYLRELRAQKKCRLDAAEAYLKYLEEFNK